MLSVEHLGVHHHQKCECQLNCFVKFPNCFLLKLPAIKKYVAKVLGREVGDTEVLCNKCRASYYRSLKIPASCTQSKDNTQRNHEDDDPEYCVNPEQSNANPLSPKTIQRASRPRLRPSTRRKGSIRTLSNSSPTKKANQNGCSNGD